jgi:hypothetical protein
MSARVPTSCGFRVNGNFDFCRIITIMESDFKVLKKTKILAPSIYDLGQCSRLPSAGRATASRGMRTRSTAIGPTSACQRPSSRSAAATLAKTDGRRGLAASLPQTPLVECNQPLPVPLGGRFVVAPALREGEAVMDAGVEFYLTGRAGPPE